MLVFIKFLMYLFAIGGTAAEASRSFVLLSICWQVDDTLECFCQYFHDNLMYCVGICIILCWYLYSFCCICLQQEERPQRHCVHWFYYQFVGRLMILWCVSVNIFMIIWRIALVSAWYYVGIYKVSAVFVCNRRSGRRGITFIGFTISLLVG